MKNRILVKVILYSFLCLFFVFYPGYGAIHRLYGLDVRPFLDKPNLNLSTNDFPRLLQEPYLEPITAEAFAVIDLDSFTPILSRNMEKKMYPASTVKLMTALVAFNRYPLDKVLTVKTTIDQELKMNLKKKEKIIALNLLYGALVYSANDAAYTLAENYPGGVKAFVNEMNVMAQELQLTKTHFKNPIGFDDPQQYTTVKDLALLSRSFIQNPILLTLTSTKAITVSDIEFENFHPLSNVNELLGDIPHIGGLKTGTTELAGQNLISFYRQNHKPLLIIVMKSLDRFADTRIILNILNSSLEYQKI